MSFYKKPNILIFYISNYKKYYYNKMSQINVSPENKKIFNRPLQVNDEIEPRQIFRQVSDIKIGDLLICLLATDDVTIIPSNDNLGQKINALQQNHKKFWPDLQNNIVSIGAKIINTKQKIKLFNLDFHSCIAIGLYAETLIPKIKEMAVFLADKWNKRNSSQNKRYARTKSHKVMVIDYRDGNNKNYRKSNRPVELAIAGTTYNYNNDVQSINANCHCTPENVYFQLRYQYNDNEGMTGMLSLKHDDMIDFLTHPSFREFCLKLNEFYPLPNDYFDRIDKYFLNRNNNNNIEMKDDDKDSTNIYRQINSDTDSEDSEDSSAGNKRKKIKL